METMTAAEYQQKHIARKKPVQHERILQIHAVSYIRSALPHVLIAHCPNGGSRNPREAENLRKMGVLRGFPDLMLFWRTGFGVIEMKSGTGKLSDHQREVLDRIGACGVHTAVCNSLQQVEETLRGWGLTPSRPAPRYIVWSEQV